MSASLPREDFFSIMSAFPTGVAIVTTINARGEPRGLTTNAVCSVSAEPPLLLVCVHVESRTLQALRQSKRFVVNFMSDRTADLCARFASKVEDKFDGVAWEAGLGGLPLLAQDALAYAECSTQQELEAGDHVVLIGLVESGRPPDPDSVPILYYQRTYGTTRVTAA